MTQLTLPAGMQITGAIKPEYADILTPVALEFVARVCRTFEPRRQELLAKRVVRQQELDAGKAPDFLSETRHIRDAAW
ncbi:MAG: malate synthase A, partial [Burkholderiales bacterium]